MHTRRSDSSQWSCERVFVSPQAQLKNALTYPVGIDIYVCARVYVTIIYINISIYIHAAVYILYYYYVVEVRVCRRPFCAGPRRYNTPNWNFEDIKDIPR